MMLFNELQREFFSQLYEPFTGEFLFDQLDDIVFFIKNAKGQYIIVNQTLVQRCGLKDKTQIIGQTPEQLHPSPLGEEYRKQDELILSQDKSILNQLELQLNTSCRTCWCLTTKVPIHGKQGQVVGLAGVSKDLDIPDKKNKDFPQIARTVTYIKENFSESLRIEELANQADLSVYQFEDRMQTIFHLTAGQFIQKIRIDNALWKLSKSDQPIVEIALDCGYADQSAFSRQFKQAVGISPAQYRRLTKEMLKPL
jgi:AraC-like DNA-binding protein